MAILAHGKVPGMVILLNTDVKATSLPVLLHSHHDWFLPLSYLHVSPSCLLLSSQEHENIWPNSYLFQYWMEDGESILFSSWGKKKAVFPLHTATLLEEDQLIVFNSIIYI